MNATYILIDLWRQLRAVPTILFVFCMPALMYILFGANATYGDSPAGNGNAKFYVMASMAAYGAVISAVTIAGMAATEAMLGWGRQLALTRQPAWGFAANKVVVAVTLAAVAEALVFAIGAATGAKAPGQVWWATFLIALAGSAIFASFGLAIGLLFKSDSAVGIATSAIVFFSFLGNVFLPLDGIMLKIARWTPMYGYIGLTRWPQLEGDTLVTDPTATPQHDAFWLLATNLVVWTLAFVALTLVGTRRARTRQ